MHVNFPPLITFSNCKCGSFLNGSGVDICKVATSLVVHQGIPK